MATPSKKDLDQRADPQLTFTCPTQGSSTDEKRCDHNLLFTVLDDHGRLAEVVGLMLYMSVIGTED